MVWTLNRNEHFWIMEQGENAIMYHSKVISQVFKKTRNPLCIEKTNIIEGNWIKVAG